MDELELLARHHIDPKTVIPSDLQPRYDTHTRKGCQNCIDFLSGLTIMLRASDSATIVALDQVRGNAA